MDGKFYDLPFRTSSGLSDFACHDGEIKGIEGAFVSQANDDTEGNIFSQPFQYEKNYKPVLPPEPLVEFSLSRATLEGWHPYPDAFPTQSISTNGYSYDDLGKKAVGLLSRFNAEALSQNLLSSPVFVMAAWRLNSGALVSPSPPMLLIPNNAAPAVATDDSPDAPEMDCHVVAALGKIVWRITLPESLRDWVGRIGSLEVLVSRPLQLYEPSTGLVYSRNVMTDNFTLCLDSATGQSAEQSVCTRTLSHAWLPVKAGSSVKDSHPASLTDFYTISSIPFGELIAYDDFKVLNINGSLADSYSSQPFTPSYAVQSLSSAKGAVGFKGRRLLWNPLFKTPAFSNPSFCVGNYSSSQVPRWVFHPDPKAKEYRYTDSGGILRTLPLIPHPSLYGSYWFGGLLPSLPTPSQAAGDILTGNSKNFESYIWMSEKNDSDVFSDNTLQDLECGEILAACRAMRTAGLVATVSPTLYIFTTEGLYLFRESSSGLFSDAGMIARYRLSSPESLELLPRGIRFSSSHGELVTLNGTTLKTLSGSDNNDSQSASVIISVVATGQPLKITTRPIKLSGAGAMKRLRKAFLRGDYDSISINFSVFGSRDFKNWFPLGIRKGGSVVNLVPVRCRFYRIEITGTPPEGSSFQGITLCM